DLILKHLLLIEVIEIAPKEVPIKVLTIQKKFSGYKNLIHQRKVKQVRMLVFQVGLRRKKGFLPANHFVFYAIYRSLA
ncbi:MAG: hypothetical protein FD167_5522, partial [bacterium]